MSAEQKIVLIVDDMKAVRLKLKMVCAELGIKHIYEASDGLEALQLLEGIRPDLILSDWNMPNMSGIELIEAIRRDVKLADIPVIFITAESDRDKILKSLIEGVTDYIVKPFPDKVVKEKICGILKIQALR